MQLLGYTALALAGGCARPPAQDVLTEVLVAQAALPGRCNVGLIRVFREDVGDFQPDYSDIYQITLDEPCRGAWQQALTASGDWDCTADTGHCVRGDALRTEGDGGSYREEWGEVRFLSSRLVQVELKKI